jgi:hypothetical protein
LLYGMTRQLVDAQNAGKALSAINLAFFLGAALMQSTTGVVATLYGLPAVLLFMAATHDRRNGHLHCLHPAVEILGQSGKAGRFSKDIQTKILDGMIQLTELL